MKRKVLSVFIFLATIALITVPLIMLTSAGTTDTVTVSAEVGNTNPTFSNATYEANVLPSAGTTKQIQINFSAIDPNGVDDFNDATAHVNITNAAVKITSDSCTAHGNAGTSETWTCLLTINYYNVPGSWTIIASVEDASTNGTSNSASSFTMDSLDDVTVTEASMSFSGSPGATNVAAAENPIHVTNTGNNDYSVVGVTAHNLAGDNDNIPATAFAVKITADPDGQALADNSNVDVTGSTLAPGNGASRSLYFYLDIPSGIESDSYTSAAWTFNPTV